MKISLHRLICLLFLGALTATLFVACNSVDSTRVTDQKQEVEDCRIIEHAMGETCVPRNPQRVVTLYNTLGNTLALGVKPIGTTYTVSEPLPAYLQEKMQGIELLGGIAQPNLERILQLKPDLILSSSELQNIYGQLSSIAPTVAMDHSQSSSWKAQLAYLAKVLDKEDASKQLMEEYWQRIDQIKHELGDSLHQTQVSVVNFYLGSITPYGELTPSGIVLKDIGLKRPPAQTGDFYYLENFSLERLSEIDGDVLFIAVSRVEGFEEALEKLRQNPLWQKLDAVQRNQVYFVDALHWHWDNILAVNAILDDLFKYLVNTP